VWSKLKNYSTDHRCVTIFLALLYNKTWNIHKTTPFYKFDKRQWTQYENELLIYIAANAKNLSSSALTATSHLGVATIVNRTVPFPGQIDSSGNNLVEAMDDPGDIKRVDFQFLNMNDTAQNINEEEEPMGISDTDSIVITVTVRPKGNNAYWQNTPRVTGRGIVVDSRKPFITLTTITPGKVRDQPYYCVIVPDQRQSKASFSQGTV
jgi:hypothetical protein